MNQLTPGVRERTSRTFVRRVGQAHMPTPGGLLDMIAYAAEDAGVRLVPEQPHLALVNGQPAREAAPLVRVHSECLTGDLFGSLRCDCGPQLDAALRAIQGARAGVVVYLRQEGRGIGLVNKLAAYNLQDHGLDTIEANERLGLPVDNRDYGIAAGILLELGIQRVRLLTNNPGKVQQLEDHGIAVLERLPLEIPAGEYNRRYLRTKRDRLGHHLAASEDEYHA